MGLVKKPPAELSAICHGHNQLRWCLWSELLSQPHLKGLQPGIWVGCGWGMDAPCNPSREVSHQTGKGNSLIFSLVGDMSVLGRVILSKWASDSRDSGEFLKWCSGWLHVAIQKNNGIVNPRKYAYYHAHAAHLPRQQRFYILVVLAEGLTPSQ